MYQYKESCKGLLGKLGTRGKLQSSSFNTLTLLCVCVNLCTKVAFPISRGPLYPSPGSGQRRAWCWVLQTYLLRDAPGHIGCSWWSYLRTLHVLLEPFGEAAQVGHDCCQKNITDPSLGLYLTWLLSPSEVHMATFIHLSSVWLPVDFRKPRVGTAPVWSSRVEAL